ncbi:MAG: sulfite exporter TauE/SafE family protein [Gammaproteobacteria bacterium]|jgi:sulfite exporter TauE/SafE|nr:sulfite exporter TauE/SafE family protein [Gammaproteobacteria bacterium]
MIASTLAGAFLAGLLGSVHCLGMCGGIAGAAAAGPGPQGRNLSWVLLYNLGRVGSYSLAGAIAGAAAFALGSAIDLPAWGAITRGLTGVILVLIGLNFALGLRLPRFLEAGGGRIWALVSPAARRLLSSRSALGMLGLGALWGWLPCGLTYTMLVAAAGTGKALDGAMLMLAFGLGTLPSMMAAGAAAGSLQRFTRARYTRRLSGVLLVILGIWTAALPIKNWLAGQAGHSHGHHTSALHAAPQTAQSVTWIVAR